MVSGQRSEVRNPIDAFVRGRLEREGIKPSPEADRYTLIRRVYLDLIGLPPTPEEVDAFVADKSPDAYEKLVDRLLASPHYGERWARQLARPRPLRRHQRLREGPPAHRSGRIATGSSTRSTTTCRSTSSRSSNSPATCCPTRRRAANRHRVSPQHDAQRGRRHRSAGVPLPRDDRPRRHHRHRLARPDGRLRAVPHAQVRSDHAPRVLPLFAFLNNADEPDFELPPTMRTRRTGQPRPRRETPRGVALRNGRADNGSTADLELPARGERTSLREWLTARARPVGAWTALRRQSKRSRTCRCSRCRRMASVLGTATSPRATPTT